MKKYRVYPYWEVACGEPPFKEIEAINEKEAIKKCPQICATDLGWGRMAVEIQTHEED